MPFVKCDTVEDVRRNRMKLLDVFDKVDMDKPIEYKVTAQDCNLRSLEGIA